MKNVLVCILLISCMTGFVKAQPKVKLTLNDYLEAYETDHSFTLKDSNEVIYFKVAESSNKYHPKSMPVYHWFADQKLQTTQGGYNGRLLHGEYIAFYPDKSLKEKGQFRYGLKKAKWTNWYADGKIKEVSNWSKGKLHGKYMMYNKDGTIIKECHYKKGVEVINAPKGTSEKTEKKPEKETKPVKEKTDKQSSTKNKPEDKQTTKEGKEQKEKKAADKSKKDEK